MGKKKNPEQYTTTPCQECGAQCCRYVAIEIDTPRTKRQYDDIRWYLLHENVQIFIDHNQVWHVEFLAPCRALSPEERCSVYAQRPQVCRDHGWPVGACEFFDSPYKERFTRLAEYERYLDRKGIDWRYKRRPATAKE